MLQENMRNILRQVRDGNGLRLRFKKNCLPFLSGLYEMIGRSVKADWVNTDLLKMICQNPGEMEVLEWDDLTFDVFPMKDRFDEEDFIAKFSHPLQGMEVLR